MSNKFLLITVFVFINTLTIFGNSSYFKENDREVYSSNNILYDKHETDSILNFLAENNSRILKGWDGKSLEKLDFITWEEVGDVYYIKSIDLVGKEIFGDVTIKDFKVLENIDISNNYLSSFKVFDTPTLKNIDISNNILYSFSSNVVVENIDLRDNLLYDSNIQIVSGSNVLLQGNYINGYNDIECSVDYEDDYAYIDLVFTNNIAKNTSKSVSKRWVKLWSKTNNDFIFSNANIQVAKSLTRENSLLKLRVPLLQEEQSYSVYLNKNDIHNKIDFIVKKEEMNDEDKEEIVVEVAENIEEEVKEVDIYVEDETIKKVTVEKESDTNNEVNELKNIDDEIMSELLQNNDIKRNKNELVEKDAKKEVVQRNTNANDVDEASIFKALELEKKKITENIFKLVTVFTVLGFIVAFFIRKINSKGR